MAVPLLGPVLNGYVHPPNWLRPIGNTDFRVTRDAAGHIAAKGPPALDLGDANIDADPIFAPCNANVSKVSRYGSANLEIDFWTGGLHWRLVFAHNTLPHPVTLRQFVARGQIIGHVGATGAPGGAHLHFQYGYWSGWYRRWIWLDPWPYFEQNHNLQFNAGVTGVRIRTAPGVTAPIWGAANQSGIMRADGLVVAPFATTLLRRAVASVGIDGYEWMPFTIPGVAEALWTAKPFTHFL